jgi:hypothetical protein
MRASILIFLALVFSSSASGDADIAAYLVESKAYTKLQSGSKKGEIFDARFTKCSRCKLVELVTPEGESISVRAERKPRIELTAGDLQHLLLAQNRDVFLSTKSYWLALAVPKDDQRDALNELYDKYPFDRLLVRLNGEPVAVDTVLTAQNTGIEVGRFLSRAELEAFAEAFSTENNVAVEWAEIDEEQFLQDRRKLEERLGSGSSLQ